MDNAHVKKEPATQ